MSNISVYGIELQIVATFTFPNGLTVTQFADDVDPFDVPSIQVADKAMGVNGDPLYWSKANLILINIGVSPNTPDDTNLSILLEANRVGRGKLSVQDTIVMTASYPNGDRIILNNGAITDGMPANSGASAGRLKSKAYSFAFGNLSRTFA